VTIDALQISTRALDDIAEHARREAPRECCGLLVGTASRIEESVPTRNIDPGVTRFQVDPQEHIALNRRLRGTGREVIGAYHSHPHGKAEPSPSDIAETHYPEFVYVILSLINPAQPVINAYRIRDGQVTVVALEKL
jgi:proteasome lid subunit RPN8/RPN11